MQSGRDHRDRSAASRFTATAARPADDPRLDDGRRLDDLVCRGGVVVLSGAGLSTESGIPDYRGPSGVRRFRGPMTYQEFTRDPAARRRYWARSHIGWQRMADAQPNVGHRAVADLERAGLLDAVITQNVDGLHQRAGADGVLELHGTLDRVICLACGDLSPRGELDRRLRAQNPGFDEQEATAAPDGDALLSEQQLDGFQVVACTACGAGPLKPDVVFFGETVPRPRVDACFDLVDGAQTLLVLGSSLTVMSGYRFVIRARERGVPVAIVNRGATRGDPSAAVLVDAALGDVLPSLVERVTGRLSGSTPR